MSLTPINEELLFSKSDPLDPRLGEWVECVALKDIRQGAWHILGYPDDEGIRLNGGRVGAREAPQVIRRFLYRMTPALNHRVRPRLLDLGNLEAQTLLLGERHELARKAARQVLRSGGFFLSLGGGHDYGFPDAAAFAEVFAGQAPLVINFDAHLDVRPTDSGFHSGTPFRRLLEEFAEVDFLEIGIQRQCNSATHLEWLHSKKSHCLELDEILVTGQPQAEAINQWLLPYLEKRRPVFVSIDLDAFSSAFAPGCSQSWPTGLTPNEIILVLDFISSRCDVYGAGLYEVSPPLDLDDRTSRLAALLAHRLIFANRRIEK